MVKKAYKEKSFNPKMRLFYSIYIRSCEKIELEKGRKFTLQTLILKLL